MSQPIPEEKKALVPAVFDTLFNSRDYAPAPADRSNSIIS
jgi:hypothetical protein